MPIRYTSNGYNALQYSQINVKSNTFTIKVTLISPYLSHQSISLVLLCRDFHPSKSLQIAANKKPIITKKKIGFFSLLQ